jgi:AcrR family transcriptional regulator
MAKGEQVARRRKRPQQERSRHTVECILKAAAHVFSQRGYANTTTNHVAARAGVSIGSLYQYFPSKDALLLALAERHVDRAFDTVMRKVLEKRRAPVPELLRALVDALVRAHQIEPQLHRVIFEEVHLDSAFHRRLDELDARALQVAHELIQERCAELSIDNPRMAGMLIVQALEGVTHAMVQRHPEALQTQEFRDELVRMLEMYLTGGAVRLRRPGATRLADAG